MASNSRDSNNPMDRNLSEGGAVGGKSVRILSAPKLGITAPKLGLLGGGETSTSVSQSSGWGAPGPSGSGQQGASGWGSGGGGSGSVSGAPGGPNEGEKQSAGAASWAATAGGHGDKGHVHRSLGPAGSAVSPDHDDFGRIAAYSSGWGQTAINQDTAWDDPMPAKEMINPPRMMEPPPNNPPSVPGSQAPHNQPPLSCGTWPHETSKKIGFNDNKTLTGTEIWECSIRQKGSKAPGGGGVGVGVPGPPGQPSGGAIGAGVGGQGGQGNMSGPAGGGNGVAGGSGGMHNHQQNAHQQNAHQQQQQNAHSWHQGQSAGHVSHQQPPPHTPSSHIGGTWGEEDVENPNSMWSGVPPPNVAPPNMGGYGEPTPQWPPQGPPPDKQWGAPHPPNGPPQWVPSQPPGWLNNRSMPQHEPTGSWNGLKEALAHVGSGGGGPNNSGWPGPNMKKEWEPNGPNDHPQRPPPGASYDDGMRASSGTAVWGNPGLQCKVSHWKDMPGPSAGGANKPNPNPLNGEWPDQKLQWQQDYQEWGAKPKMVGVGPDWADGQIDTSAWGGPTKQGGKPLTKDLIYASKQFRLITGMGFPKEDAENALRACNMELVMALNQCAALSRERRFSLPPSSIGHWTNPTMQWDPASRVPPPPLKGQSQAPPHSHSNASPHSHSYSPSAPQSQIHSGVPAHGCNDSMPRMTSMGGAPGGPGVSEMDASINNGNHAPSAAQLRVVVSQIQAAVHAGYLNPQILNQPLAPQTLILLFHLLAQMKELNRIQQKGPMAHPMQAIQCRTKIAGLQSQIAAQQASFLKQQPPPPSGTESRLNQWKLPSPPGNNANQGPTGSNMSGENKSPGVNAHNNNSNGNANKWDPPTSQSLDNLHGGSEPTVSLNPVTSLADSNINSPSNSATTSSNISSSNNANMNYIPSISDIIAEFKPGEPWKGSWNMRSADDDPHMTPGSVQRNPLVAPIKTPDNNESGLFHLPANSSVNDWMKQGIPTSNADSGINWSSFGSNGAGRSKKWMDSDVFDNMGCESSLASSEKAFVVLKNLTAQIDGSTLRTLCMQHGPLHLFRLFLTKGFALVQYGTREEALKAEAALNNCVLSNTTILAYIPTQSDVESLLAFARYKNDISNQVPMKQPLSSQPQQMTQSNTQQQGGWPSFGGGATALWGPPEGSSDPGSLNSFLPGDLLSGESM